MIVIAACAVCACGVEMLEEAVRSNPYGIWESPSFGNLSPDASYALGVDYPEGYDWHSDPEKETVRAELVMFADGIPVLKIPVGRDAEVSSDPSTHRIIGGHLYTFYTDGLTTVLKKDGRPLVRYEGAEEIIAVKIPDTDVHTLARPSDGAGFCYRVNGVPAVQRSSGDVFGPLVEYGDTVAFCFWQDMRESGHVVRSCYVAADGKVVKVDVEAGVTSVLDMHVSEGMVSMLAEMEGEDMPVLISGGRIRKFRYPGMKNVASCRFLDMDSPCACVRISHPGSSLMTDLLWTEEGIKMHRIGCTLSAAYADDLGTVAVINPSDDRQGQIFVGSRAFPMPSDCHVVTDRAMVRRDSSMRIGLSSDGPGPPAVWVEGRLDTLDINGFLTFLQ